MLGWTNPPAPTEPAMPTAEGARERPLHVSAIDLEAGLDRLGLPAFRPGQREAIETLLRQRRLLLVAPTGGGKSLVYQLPALLLPGTTLVISPLISLMQDQVRALEARGVAATFLAATLEPDEAQRRSASIARGDLELVYAAPERLALPGFRALLRELRCPLVAIDEAHCISEWGHDFRPEYLQIGELLEELPDALVLACTATATPIVRDEILARLGLDPATPQLVRGFARPNLSLRALEVGGRRERDAHVDAALAEALGEPGAERGTAIVYAPTRRASETEAQRLASRGWRAVAYHAGLGGEERAGRQSAFAAGRVEVVVATNAFGMGIDRADVRAVVHLAPPGSIEAYYQEVGRAGRDGESALGLLLVSPGDLARRRSLIEGDAPDAELARHKWNLFLELMRFAEGGSCRHDAILRYFGDEEETLAGCGRCDVCRALAGGNGPGEPDAEETALVVRKALSAVARLRGRFGLGAAAALLRGTEDERLRRAGLAATRTFGTLSEYDEAWLLRLLRRCVAAGWVDFAGGERPVVLLTEEGRSVMLGERPARLLLPPRAARSAPGARPGAAASGRTPAGAGLDAGSRELFEALRRHRLELARARGVPPYVVASDRSLREIASLRPRTVEELQLAHGIGPAKAHLFGRGLLDVVERHRASASP
jgi:ATP-dependent DNA helicase RecQ